LAAGLKVVGTVGWIKRGLGVLSWRQRRGRETQPKGSKTAEQGVETADAGSLPSRRRVSTTGLAVSLPIVRLPERFGPEPASAESSESKSVSNGLRPTVRIAFRRFAAASREATPCMVSHLPQARRCWPPDRVFGKDRPAIFKRKTCSSFSSDDGMCQQTGTAQRASQRARQEMARIRFLRRTLTKMRAWHPAMTTPPVTAFARRTGA
jgi:hypothetical protein